MFDINKAVNIQTTTQTILKCITEEEKINKILNNTRFKLIKPTCFLTNLFVKGRFCPEMVPEEWLGRH